MDDKLIYIASPYSHKKRSVMALRKLIIDIIGSKLVEEGQHVFGPITESACYQQISDVPGNWDFWGAHDKLMLSKCDEMWVLLLHGWRKSVGVQAEIKFALEHQIPIMYKDPVEIAPEIMEVL